MISLPTNIETENIANRFSYALAAMKHPLQDRHKKCYINMNYRFVALLNATLPAMDIRPTSQKYFCQFHYKIKRRKTKVLLHCFVFKGLTVGAWRIDQQVTRSSCTNKKIYSWLLDVQNIQGHRLILFSSKKATYEESTASILPTWYLELPGAESCICVNGKNLFNSKCEAKVRVMLIKKF